MAKSTLDWIALVLLIVGGLNWGLVGFGYNLVESLLGGLGATVVNVIYWLVGLSALYTIYYLFK